MSIAVKSVLFKVWLFLNIRHNYFFLYQSLDNALPFHRYSNMGILSLDIQQRILLSQNSLCHLVTTLFFSLFFYNTGISFMLTILFFTYSSGCAVRIELTPPDPKSGMLPPQKSIWASLQHAHFSFSRLK